MYEEDEIMYRQYRDKHEQEDPMPPEVNPLRVLAFAGIGLVVTLTVMACDAL